MTTLDHQRRAPALVVRHLTKRFANVPALVDVDLTVDVGEVVALMGENGAGKSTLVKVLAGVHPPSSGAIAVNGVAVRIDSPYTARSLGIASVFQNLPLCNNLDVVENLFLGRELRPLRLDKEGMERQGKQLLRQMSAGAVRVRSLVGALSGGQRQSVSIARTLLGDPSIVVLDEPTAALGRKQRVEVLDQIARLRDRGIGVLLISHNLDDVGEVADRVAVLRHGRNNGVFSVPHTTPQEIYEAVSGAPFDPATFHPRRRSAATMRPT